MDLVGGFLLWLSDNLDIARGPLICIFGIVILVCLAYYAETIDMWR